MKKILISLLILLLGFLMYTVVVNGIEIAGFTVHGYQDIQKMNQELDSKLTEASKATSIDYPEKLSSLSVAAKQLTTAKETYQDKIAYSSEEEIKLATQVKEYKLEFLYTKLGNYRLKEGVGMELIFEQKSTGENVWNIHFIITGKYLPITEYIRDIEDDDELNFRIENFKLTPGTSTESLKADFYVRRIGLTEVDSSIVNTNVQTTNDNNNKNTNSNNDNNNKNTNLAS